MLKDQLFISGSWVDAACRLINGTGTPVSAAAANGDGRAIADDYSFTFTGVTATVTGTVHVAASSPNNPYGGQSFVVNLDNTTEYKDVIPGLTLKFSNSGSFGNTWTAAIHVGEFLGTFDAFGGGAGVPSAGVRHRVINGGTGAVSASKATLDTIAKWVKITGHVFDTIRNFAAGATEKQAGGGSNQVIPYAITISATAGSGPTKTVTVSVDGTPFATDTLTDLSTGVDQNGTLVKAVSPGRFYRVNSGDLEGLEFAIDATAADGDEANVLIFESRFIQLAPDVSGSAGAWDITDIVLTQAGQSAGVIQPAGTAFFWRRVLVPAGGNAESNPYPGDVALKGTETGAAGWLD